MDQRISLITLGTRDLERALRFYRDGLGWRPSSASVDGVVAFFAMGGVVLSLWSREEQARDAQIVDGGGWGGVALVHNVRARAAVDAVIEEAVAAGGSLLRAATDADWGGYSGYVADPEGHPWEIAWNPSFPLDENGLVQLPA